MPGKIKLIQIAEPPKRNPFARAAAGVLLSGVLAASCAPELVQINSKSTIMVTAAQPEKIGPGWETFSQKYGLTNTEKEALSKMFLDASDKTGFWPSDVFDTLMKNGNLRKNQFELSCRLISSVVRRSDHSNAKNALDALSFLFRNPKSGGTELNTVIRIVENDPTMNPDKIGTIYNSAFTFSSDFYSPEFSKAFQHFFFGNAVSSYLSSSDMKMIIDSFHALAINRSYSPEMLGIISGISDDFSERVPQLVKASVKKTEKLFGETAHEPWFNPGLFYQGPTGKGAALAILRAISNPNLNQQMLEDFRFELRSILYSEYAETGSGGSTIEALGKIYGSNSFGKEASAKLRGRFGKKEYSYDTDEFLDSLLIIAKGRGFGQYDRYLFLEAFEQLERFESMLKRKAVYSVNLSKVAEIISHPKFSARVSENLGFLIRKSKAQSLENDIAALRSIMQSADFSYDLLDKFDAVLATRNRMCPECGLEYLLRNSGEQANILENEKFIISQISRRARYVLPYALEGSSDLMKDPNLRQKFKRAKEFAKEIGARYRSQEITINFVYALETIGEEKTRSLYERFGIEYFARYPKQVLEEAFLAENRGHKRNFPIAFFVFNKNDWNGAFYTDGEILSQFTGKYRICLIEVDSEQDFFGGLESFVQNRMLEIGNHKIGVLMLGGHGYEEGIFFGPYARSSAELTASDMRGLKELKGYFSETPTVILNSCSTGKNEHAIGARISRALGARLFAPKKPGGITSISFGPEGEILDVEYSVERSEFESGKMKKEEKK